jgi:hypothetical protein
MREPLVLATQRYTPKYRKPVLAFSRFNSFVYKYTRKIHRHQNHVDCQMIQINIQVIYLGNILKQVTNTFFTSQFILILEAATYVMDRLL